MRHGLLIGCVLVLGTGETAEAKKPPAATTRDAGVAVDAIERLVARLSRQPLWANGAFPKVALPASAATAEVVAQVLARVSFDRGRVRKHRVVSERQVRIGDEVEPYTAVLTETDQGELIVLLRHQGDAVGWWSRVFTAGE